MLAKKSLAKLICFWAATALAFAPTPLARCQATNPPAAEPAIHLAEFSALIRRDVAADDAALNQLAEQAEALAHGAPGQVVGDRAGAHLREVGTRLRLGENHRPGPLAADHLRQKLLLLHLRTT